MFARVARAASLAVARRGPSAAFAPAFRALQTREKSSLVSILQREIDEEKGNCFEGDELEALRAKVDAVFQLQETPGRMEVVLEGSVGADSIRIKFDADNSVDLDEDDYLDDDEDEEEEHDHDHDHDEEEEDDEEDELPGIRFTADVTRDNQGLQFECVASSNLTVERVRFLKDAVKDVEDEALYVGPTFMDLELDVQDKLYGYLADRKIDDELAQFITQYADLKEQREYLAFLQDTAAFVKH
ncbi:hypothetical protein BBJ28_00019625 [Nothophytophthora sp. Chile5]|nr:hypothetical protein BBJ28_00019625 [Nothophytophthora sp. Chile5]